MYAASQHDHMPRTWKMVWTTAQVSQARAKARANACKLAEPVLLVKAPVAIILFLQAGANLASCYCPQCGLSAVGIAIQCIQLQLCLHVFHCC